MKPKIKEIIYSQLKEVQEKYGGYTGTDIATISRKINRQPKTVRRQIEKLRDYDASFSIFTYIGKRYIDLTLDEISFLQYRLQDNCLMLKSLLLEDLNKRRIEEGKSQIPLSTFYKFLGNLMNGMGINENDPYRWLKTKGMSVTEKYSIENARVSIQTLFSFRGLKNISIADLEGVNERLKECKRWLEGNYTGIGNIITHYDQIKKRKHKLRSLLASIKSDVGIAIQVRLIFEIQAYFFVDLLDFLIEQLIINKGRIYRLMSDKRPKVENRLRKERLSKVGDDISDLFRGHIEKEKLFNQFMSHTSIETLARVALPKSHKSAYSKLLKILRSLAANFSEDVIEIHHDTAEVIIELLREEKNWNSMDIKQKKSILRDEDLVGIIDEHESDVLSCILTNRVINHIKSGKITFKSSHQFCEMGALIGSLPITEEEYRISPEMLNEMLENKLEITAEPISVNLKAPQNQSWRC